MKWMMIVFTLFGCLIFSGSANSGDELNHIIRKKELNQSDQNKSRRKKIQMCHECGKPEPECECEGEEHGVKDQHHDQDEK